MVARCLMLTGLRCSYCRVVVHVMFLFLAVPWVVLWSVTVAFPVHIHLLFIMPIISAKAYYCDDETSKFVR